MVNTIKTVSLAKRLNSGEEIRCDYCKKGIYKPMNPKAAINHCFMNGSNRGVMDTPGS